MPSILISTQRTTTSGADQRRKEPTRLVPDMEEMVEPNDAPARSRHGAYTSLQTGGRGIR